MPTDSQMDFKRDPVQQDALRSVARVRRLGAAILLFAMALFVALVAEGLR